MKKKLLMLSAISLLMIASCTKSKDEPTPEKESTCLLKSSDRLRTNFGQNYSNKYFFNYNDQQQLSRIDFDTEKSTTFKTFSYDKNKITAYYEGIYQGLKETYEVVYTLDAEGRIASYANDENGTITTLRYNADGFLANAKTVYTDKDGNSTDVQTFTYTAGNLTEIVLQSGDPAGEFHKSVSTFTYGNDAATAQVAPAVIEVIIPDDLEEELIGFIGKGSKNLPTKLVTVNTRTQSQYNSTETFLFSYVKDAKGNVTSVKTAETRVLATETIVVNEETKFNYTCK